MPEKAEKKRRWPYLVILAALILAYIVWGLTAHVNNISPLIKSKASSLAVPQGVIKWPSFGQAAIGLNNLGVVAENGNQKPQPTASIAKLITALCVLKKYPLRAGDSGPEITISPADVAIYQKYQSEQGSDLLVQSGEQLSEYQMLQAMLMPSADNLADSLATWAFGSLSDYSTYANSYLAASKLSDTHVGIDASGYDPSTTSTAYDLVNLGELAMANPVIASIVGQTSASGFPYVGTIKNVNFLLGQDNIIGLKTGNTDQAGGVFLSASKISVNGQPLTIITAVMQAPTLYEAMVDSLPLIVSAQDNFNSSEAPIQSGSLITSYPIPWEKSNIPASAASSIEVSAWGGSKISESLKLNKINGHSKAGDIVGALTVKSNLPSYSNTTNIILDKSVDQPSRWWLLIHPDYFIHI